METYLTIKEVAELKGCGIRYLQKLVSTQSIKSKQILTAKNRPQYLIPLFALGEKEQQKYIKLYAPLSYPDASKEETKSNEKYCTVEDFTEEQRKK